MEERVATLTAKMIERLRPFVEAKDPGGKDDQETKAFEQKMMREAEDLKLESFGVEVRFRAPSWRKNPSNHWLRSSSFIPLAPST